MHRIPERFKNTPYEDLPPAIKQKVDENLAMIPEVIREDLESVDVDPMEVYNE